ncbi:hypothetical protein L2E82_51198 [Cichorium intybus]|nr:hypothetical protein L2E82_51198 [Cichorium intybus]
MYFRALTSVVLVSEMCNPTQRRPEVNVGSSKRSKTSPFLAIIVTLKMKNETYAGVCVCVFLKPYSVPITPLRKEL